MTGRPPTDLRSRGRERGTALIVVLTVMLMVLAICATVLQSVTRESRASTEVRERMRAFYLAETGFNLALSKVRANASLRSAADIATAATITETAFGHGLCWTVAAPTASGDMVVITATGWIKGTALTGDIFRRVEGVVDATYNRPIRFKYAAHGGGVLYAETSTTFDSYTSTPSVPSPSANVLLGLTGQQHGDLSADGSFQIYTPTRARGTLYLGPEGMGTGSAKNGTVQLPEPQRMPRILRPDGLPLSSGPISLTGTAVMTIGPGTYVYDSIYLQDTAQLRIIGPATVVCDGIMQTWNSSQIYMDHGPSRRIAAYIADAHITYTRVASTIAAPATCNIWFTGTQPAGIRPVSSGSNTAFYGTAYLYGDSIDSYILLGSTQPLVGSIYGAGQAMAEMVGGPRIVYDEVLAGVDLPVSSAPTFEIKRWRDVP